MHALLTQHKLPAYDLEAIFLFSLLKEKNVKKFSRILGIWKGGGVSGGEDLTLCKAINY